jgi:hypothetical protein
LHSALQVLVAFLRLLVNKPHRALSVVRAQLRSSHWGNRVAEETCSVSHERTTTDVSVLPVSTKMSFP